VEGLPQTYGPAGLIVAALCFALCAAVWLLARPKVAARLGGPRDPVTLVVVTMLAVGVAAVPYASWRIVEDIRYTSALDPWLAQNYGVSVYEVHPALYDRVRELVPDRDTYYLRASQTRDPASIQAFRQWALGALLPRVSVTDPWQAKWLLTLGVDPRTIGPPVDRVWVVRQAGQGVPTAYLGRVAA
jgi:hypothetical protein